MDISRISRWRYAHTMFWAVCVSVFFVIVAAALGRASINMTAALTDKPDIAIYLLLPDEEIGKTTLLRERENERDYLAETKDGHKLIKLKRGDNQWYVDDIVPLRE